MKGNDEVDLSQMQRERPACNETLTYLIISDREKNFSQAY